jgi:hypothetical protein
MLAQLPFLQCSIAVTVDAFRAGEAACGHHAEVGEVERFPLQAVTRVGAVERWEGFDQYA